jgi:hypothetical protein
MASVSAMLRLHLGALGRRNLVVLLRHHHADILRQLFHGIDKTHARVLDHETDSRAVGAATEAVVELLGGTDGKTGDFSLWKGHKPMKLAPPFFSCT